MRWIDVKDIPPAKINGDHDLALLKGLINNYGP